MDSPAASAPDTPQATAHTPPERLATVQLMRLSALWFGFQFFWTSNQLVVLPKKVRMFVLEMHGNVDMLGLYRSLIDSVGAALVIFTQLTIGFISDHAESKLGRRRPFILFGVLTGLGGIVLFMLAPGYWWLFAAYMVIQFCLNVASVPFQSLLPDLVPEKQHSQAGALMGINHVGGQLVGLIAYIGMVVAFGDDLQRGWLSILLPAYVAVLLLTGALVFFGIDERGWMQGARRKVAESVATLRLRPFILFVVFTILGGIIMFMIAPGYWWLFAVFMVFQLCFNLANVQSQRLLPFILFGLLTVLGCIFMFLLAPGYWWLFTAYLVIQFCLTVVSVPFQRLLPGTIVRYQRRTRTLLGTIARDYLAIDLRAHPNFLWLALSRFAMYFGYTTFLDWVAYYVEINLDGAGWLKSLGLGEGLMGIVLPAMLVSFLLTALAGNLASAPLAKATSKKAVIAGGGTLAIVMFIPLIFTSNVWVAIGAGVLLGAGWGAFIAADWAFACTVMPKEMAGSFMGLWTVTGLLPQTLGPLVSGPVRDLVFNNAKAGMGAHGAEAFAHQVLFGLVIAYFVCGLLLLRKVREPRTAGS